MNKQELINNLKEYRDTYPKEYRHSGLRQGLSFAIEAIGELDDNPKKELMPQYVVNWIVLTKDTGFKLSGAMDFDILYYYRDYSGIDYKKLKRYLNDEVNQCKFALAWINGYEIEVEYE